jgi:hypothetical protein
VLPDPVAAVPLAAVLAALPEPEVQRRPLSAYEQVLDG